MPRARIRSYNYREKTHILACVHVIPVTYIYRSLVIRCLVVKIEHLQVTVDGVTLKKKAMQSTALNNLKKCKRAFFPSGGFSRETQN